ncbi:glycosyl transferase [Shewanella maritima]|uniref:glycosyl transferase n=1 Tax=Shewanella maritima TaxID=2520507 RepID=UPI0013EE4241|nr:glycosyl transferase [Shewanella maritima]
MINTEAAHTSNLIDIKNQLATVDFKQLIKALGKGVKGSRNLTLVESQQLFAGFACGLVSQVQMASAMMLMRVRGESAEEIAGAAMALKQLVSPSWQQLKVDIDWPVYAGKREQLPWLLLAAKLLAQQGHRVLLHGDSLSLAHRRHVACSVNALDIKAATTAEKAQSALTSDNIVYVEAHDMLPVLDDCRALHQELGLRSLIQMAVRCVNPTNARLSLRSYFHPGLDKQHLAIAKIMANAQPLSSNGHNNYDLLVATFKGLQGETEINPRVSTKVSWLNTQGCSNQSHYQKGVINVGTRLEAFFGAKTGQADLDSAELMHIWQHGELSGSASKLENATEIFEQAMSSVESSLALVIKLLELTQTVKANNPTITNCSEIELSTDDYVYVQTLWQQRYQQKCKAKLQVAQMYSLRCTCLESMSIKPARNARPQYQSLINVLL